MDIEERIRLFRGMLDACHGIYYIRYNENLELTHTESPEGRTLPELFDLLDFSEFLAREDCLQQQTPFLIESGTGMLWICSILRKNGRLHSAHLFGPAFGGSTSILRLRGILHEMRLPRQVIENAVRGIEAIPLVQQSTLLQYCVMLHYLLTGEKISVLNIHTLPVNDFGKDPENDPEQYAEHHGVFEQEQKLLRMIREGHPDTVRVLENSISLSDGMRMRSGTGLLRAQMNVVVLLTLVSRAAIDGGLPASVSYTLNDYYADRIVSAGSIAAVHGISRELFEEYLARVREVRSRSGLSPVILETCDYIRTHLESPLDIQSLADRAGYEEYYFSSRFRKETGTALLSYIHEKKMDRAGDLLRGTNMNLSEIQERLCIPSRSRFYELFKKYKGVTPAQYRAYGNP